MHIAILGGSSQIAKDLAKSLGLEGEHFLSIYARRPEIVRAWLNGSAAESYYVGGFEEFTRTKIKFDAVINFVGVGNPARLQSLGAEILDITNEFDLLALDYVKKHPHCRYIFASSGAVYGGNFTTPVDADSQAVFPVNSLSSASWYGVAKLHAECRHRALKDYSIVDIRFFNYFSAAQDLNDRFLIADALRAVKNGHILKVSDANIVRDYMGPDEVHSLVRSILQSQPINIAVDTYTKAAVDKFQLLDAMRNKMRLSYLVDNYAPQLNPTGIKVNYYSENYRARDVFGYVPDRSAIEVILQEAEILFLRQT